VKIFDDMFIPTVPLEIAMRPGMLPRKYHAAVIEAAFCIEHHRELRLTGFLAVMEKQIYPLSWLLKVIRDRRAVIVEDPLFGLVRKDRNFKGRKSQNFPR